MVRDRGFTDQERGAAWLLDLVENREGREAPGGGTVALVVGEEVEESDAAAERAGGGDEGEDRGVGACDGGVDFEGDGWIDGGGGSG